MPRAATNTTLAAYDPDVDPDVVEARRRAAVRAHSRRRRAAARLVRLDELDRQARVYEEMTLEQRRVMRPDSFTVTSAERRLRAWLRRPVERWEGTARRPGESFAAWYRRAHRDFRA